MKKYNKVVDLKQEQISLEEIILAGAAENVRMALEQERGNYLKAMERLKLPDGSPAIVGNGYGKERPVMSAAGYVPVSMPRTKNRGEYERFDGSLENFRSEILPPYARKSLKMEQTIPLLYLHGLSTNDFLPALVKIYGDKAAGISASTVGRMLLDWGKELETWKARDFKEKEYCYMWIDGIYFGARNSTDDLCMLVLIGATKDGRKELIMTEAGYRESTESWLSLLRRLKSQGLTAPKLFIGDGALGFWAAARQVFPGVKEQRCWVHKTANVLDKLPKSQHTQAKPMIHNIYMAASKKDALVAWDRFCNTYRDKYPKAVECLEKDKDKLLTFYDFPAAHWSHIRTTNPIESTFSTARLRSKKTRGNWSSDKTEMMVFKLLQKASSRWKRLRKYTEVLKVMTGVIYEDGIEKAA